jgi:hypothetical protein
VTLKAFLFLLVVTIVAVVGAALIAEAIVGPGFERGILIAVLASLVVFPAARWAEYRGWIKGDWSPGSPLRKAQDARREREAAEGQHDAGAAGSALPDPASGTEPTSAGDDRPAAGTTSPGDPR